MTSIPPYRIKVPLLLGGAGASELAPLLVELGFDAKVASEQLGIASAVKMCRSVMIKGLEAMVIESFTTARAYGVEDAVLASLTETFPGIDWEKQGAYFFQRVIEHGRRRSEEVREVAETVREAGLTPWSAQGTAERQAWVADLADDGLFGAKGTRGICPQRRLAHRGRPHPRHGQIEQARELNGQADGIRKDPRLAGLVRRPRQNPVSRCRPARWMRIVMCSAPALNSRLRPSANTRPAMRRGSSSMRCATISALRATWWCRPPATAPTTARWSMR